MKSILLLFGSVLLSTSILSADPGESTVINVCSQDQPFELISALQGTPDPGGIWTDPEGVEVMDGMYDPGVSIQGEYTYTVDGTEGAETETEEISVVNCTEAPANNQCFSAQFISLEKRISFTTFD